MIDADSFWVDGYFEETFLDSDRRGDAASVKLMGYPQILRGHVESFARGINVANATPSGWASRRSTRSSPSSGSPSASRSESTSICPDDVRLVAGLTATVAIDSGASAAAPNAPATAKPNVSTAAPISSPPRAASPVVVPGAGEAYPLRAGRGRSRSHAAWPAGTGRQSRIGRRLALERGAGSPKRGGRGRGLAAAVGGMDAATAEADEILSDKTFDDLLNLTDPASLVPQPMRAPETLRRRGRVWRRHERR